MKKYLILIIVSFVLVLIALLAGLMLTPASSIGEESTISSRSHQHEINLHAPRLSIANPGHLSFERVSDQAITLQLPEAYLQKQLNLVLDTVPFGSETRDYYSLPEQVCLSFPTSPGVVSPLQEPVTSLGIDWKAAWNDLYSPAYDSYVISLWHPFPTPAEYTLVVEQDELLEMQSDPSLACADSWEKTEIEW